MAAGLGEQSLSFPAPRAAQTLRASQHARGCAQTPAGTYLVRDGECSIASRKGESTGCRGAPTTLRCWLGWDGGGGCPVVPKVPLCWVRSWEGCLGPVSVGGQPRDGPTQLCAVHIRVQTLTRVYVHTHVHTDACACRHAYTHSHLHTDIQAHSDLHTHTCTPAQSCTRIHLHACAHMWLCTHVCTPWHRHAHTHICGCAHTPIRCPFGAALLTPSGLHTQTHTFTYNLPAKASAAQECGPAHTLHARHVPKCPREAAQGLAGHTGEVYGLVFTGWGSPSSPRVPAPFPPLLAYVSPSAGALGRRIVGSRPPAPCELPFVILCLSDAWRLGR